MIHVVVAAPTQALRAGLRALLSVDEQIEVTGEAASLTGLDELPPDTDVVVDAASTYSEVASQADLQNTLKWGEPYPALLLLTGEADIARSLSGLPVRAWGILPVDASGEELVVAVKALQEGLWVAAPHLVEHLFSRPLPSPGGVRVASPYEIVEEPLHEPLTARETEVLQLLAQGLANKQIAVALGISEHTVKFHISSIYGKLEVTNRTEAVRAGARRGLVLL